MSRKVGKNATTKAAARGSFDISDPLDTDGGGATQRSKYSSPSLTSAALKIPTAPAEVLAANVNGLQPLRIEQLPVKPTVKAFELLAQQPTSLIGLSQQTRNEVVVTAVVDDSGEEHVLSRFGDEIWDLSPELAAKNRPASMRKIAWPTDVPQALVYDAKAAVYCALRQGRRGGDWSASSAWNVGSQAAVILRYVTSLGLINFSQVRALHLIDYIAEFKKLIASPTLNLRIAIIDLVWSFQQEMFHPLPEHPFGGKALYDVVGWAEGQSSLVGKTGKTPVIPPSIQKRLWEYGESVIETASQILNARHQGLIEGSSPSLTALRDVILYQLQITSGTRNSESTGVTNGCWWSEERTLLDGSKVVFHWIRTREIKTTGGKEMDYLVPGEIFSSLEILQKYAEPLQQRLKQEAHWLSGLLAGGADSEGRLLNGTSIAQTVQRLNHVREIGQHMLLSISKADSDHLGTGSRVEVMSVEACGGALKRMVHDAGVEWKIANHQCRRTFAWNVANSRLGRMGLVFLKWQLKHASISWTQLYAANPHQDQALYQEFGDAMWESKIELIRSWQSADMRLSGGAGKKLMQSRATPVRDLKQLIEATADSVTLRSTGHAWCMSGTQGCHGQGVYDPTMCGGCSQAVIDESQSGSWQMIHLDNLRLAAITDCGPAVEAKGKKAIEVSTQVLKDLGVDLPSVEQAVTYQSEVQRS